MNELQIFCFKENEVRTVKDEKGEMWWVAKDVFSALDITFSGSKSLKNIKDTWKQGPRVSDPNGRMQETIMISEPAVYKLAFRSNKIEAEEFTDWVASEVLPSIRKTGSFHSTEIVKLADDWQRAQDNIIAYNKKWNEEHKIKIS